MKRRSVIFVIFLASTGIAVAGIAICACILMMPVMFPPLAPGKPHAAYAAETESDGYTLDVALISTHRIFALYRAEVQIRKGDRILAQKDIELSGPADSTLRVFRNADRLTVISDFKTGFVVVVPTGQVLDVTPQDIPKDFPDRSFGEFTFVDGRFQTRYSWIENKVAGK